MKAIMNLVIRKTLLTALLTLGGIIKAAEPTRLMDAVKTGPTLEAIQEILSETTEKRAINRTNATGDTALLLFIANASKVTDKETKIAILQTLIDQGSNVYAQYPDGKTVFMRVAEIGDADTVQYFLDNFSAFNLGDINAQDNTGNTALLYLMRSQSLPDSKTKITFIEAFINKGADKNTKYHPKKYHTGSLSFDWHHDMTLLMIAANRGDADVLEFLLDRFEWSINDRDSRYVMTMGYRGMGGQWRTNQTALDYLFESSIDSKTKIKLIEKFIAKGADTGGQTLLMCAIKLGYIDIVLSWLNDTKNTKVHDSLTKTDNEGRTALYVAVEHKQLPILEKLLSMVHATTIMAYQGAGPDKKTPLMKAVETGWLEGVQAFMKKKESLNERDAQGRTALHYAIEQKSLPITELLLTNGADTSIGAGTEQKTPLMRAVEIGWVEGVQLFMKYDKSTLNRPDARGWTALHYAAHHPIYQNITKLLVDAGAGINIKDKDGRDPWSHMKESYWFSTQNNLIGKELPFRYVSMGNGEYLRCAQTQECGLGPNQRGYCCSRLRTVERRWGD